MFKFVVTRSSKQSFINDYVNLKIILKNEILASVN